MSESLGSRVSRIIAGGFHSLLDKVENAAPEAVMEQAARGIDDAIRDVRADLGRIEAQRHLTSRRLIEEGQRHEELLDQARLAVEENRDDLATAAVERQMDIEAQIPVLQVRLAELDEEKTRLEGYVTALQAKKREMHEELAAYRRASDAQRSATGRPGGHPGESIGSRAERAAEAFSRIYQRKTGLKGTSGSGMQSAAQLAELEDLARRNRVQERLQQLKASRES